MPRLDEKALRRPDFTPGSPVVLADGQAWQFRRPIVRFVPADNDEGFEVRASMAGDDKYPDLMAAAEAATAGAAVIKSELAIGRHLLLLNYDLSPAQLGDVLQFGFGDADEDGARIRAEVMDVARGNGPKPSAAGGGE